jgi:hypothetical protein
MGFIGVLIWNKNVKYESKLFKYIWNILVLLCGPLGLITGILTWIDNKI